MPRQKLNLNLEELFPGDTLDIGNQTIHIRPLGVQQLAIIAKKLKGAGKLLAKDGINWENYSQPDNIISIATLLLDQFPEVLEEASNIDVKDLQKLPLESILPIINKVIDVNLESKESLSKNFQNLISKINIQEVPKM